MKEAVFALAKWQYILYIEIVKATENRKYEHTKAYIEMGFETEDTKELKRIIEIRDNILENMKKYQTRMTK